MPDQHEQGDDRPYTIRQEVRALGWIAKRYLRLSPAGRRWLRSWIEAHEDDNGGGSS